MGVSHAARALGRLGGLARARALSRQQRQRIASAGGRAKALSRHAERRIRDNFRALEMIEALRRSTGGHGGRQSVRANDREP